MPEKRNLPTGVQLLGSASTTPQTSDAATAVVHRSDIMGAPQRMATGPQLTNTGAQWKLRSPVGLVYDFPSLDALKTWLGSRESVQGMKASSDAGLTWQDLGVIPELAGSLPSRRKSTGPNRVVEQSGRMPSIAGPLESRSNPFERREPSALAVRPPVVPHDTPQPTVLLSAPSSPLRNPPPPPVPAEATVPVTAAQIQAAVGVAIPASRPPVGYPQGPPVPHSSPLAYSGPPPGPLGPTGVAPPRPIPELGHAASRISRQEEAFKPTGMSPQPLAARPPAPSAGADAALYTPPTPVARPQGPAPPGPLPTGAMPSLRAPGLAPPRSHPRPSVPSGAFRAVRSGGYQAVSARRGPRVARSGKSLGTKRDTSGLTWIGVVLLLGFITVMALQVAGVYDFKGALGIGSSAADSTVEAADQGPDGVETRFGAGDTTLPVNTSPEVLTSREQSLRQLAERRQGVNPHRHLVRSYLEQARQAHRSGDVRRAIELAHHAIELDRYDPDLFCYLGTLYREQGALTEAEAYTHQCGVLRGGGTGPN